MKDALGGSMLLYIVVIFVSIVILFFVGIIAYSKAYKVKNKIIEVIERNEGYINIDDNGKNKVEEEIIQELTKVGYRVISDNDINKRKNRCIKDSSRGNCVDLNTSPYYYCVCESDNAVNEGKSFEVITYVQFEFPIIGDLLTFPVKGETRVLGKNYNY